MRWHRIVALASVVTTALLWSDPAGAFCRTMTCKTSCEIDEDKCPIGTPVRWESSCVGISVDAKGSALLDRPEIDRALRDAMRAWNDVDCGEGTHPSVQLLQLADVDCGHADYLKGGPNANVLHFRDESWDGPTNQETIALTTLTFGKSAADIRDADIAINTANKRIALDGNVAGAFDLRVVLTHEIGHLLGIAHSNHADATMNPAVETGDVSPRKLSADDIAAICDAYPPDDNRKCNAEPEGGLGGCHDPVPKQPRCSTSSSPVETTASVHWLGLVALAFAGALRRRKSDR